MFGKVPLKISEDEGGLLRSTDGPAALFCEQHTRVGLPHLVNEDELSVRALEHGLALRASKTRGGIAASVSQWFRMKDGEVGARLRITDGRRFGWLSVVVRPGSPIPRQTDLELDVEEFARKLPADSRLDTLEKRSPWQWADGCIRGETQWPSPRARACPT